MNNITGKILKSVGGFFHVETSDGLLSCTARGIFRLKNLAPVAGDIVTVEIIESTPVITDVAERKNHIIRPPLSNIDAVIIAVSTTEPSPNRLILDKLIAIFESKEIEPVPLFTKIDKKEEDELRGIYTKAGFTVFSVSNESGDGVSRLRDFLLSEFNPGNINHPEFGYTFAIIGNTGVGKSSTLNSLFPELSLETAEISKKLGRGKHTTRQVELYELGKLQKESQKPPKNGNNTSRRYIADTPGFSTVEAAKYGKLASVNAALCFREFKPFLDKCKFSGCRHTKEEGCAVIKAKERGEITASRFESYLRIFEDAWNEERNYK